MNTQRPLAYADPEHDGNSSRHQTGKRCITKGCEQPAGTAWSLFWCRDCNAKRMDRVSQGFASISKKFDEMETK